MSEIRILDCTLRDGGYVNNWKFGFENISRIISMLLNSNIDYIEIGYLNPKSKYSKNSTIFNKFSDITELFDNKEILKKCTIMANLEDIENTEPEVMSFPIHIRLAFKPYQINQAITLSEQLIKKNIPVSLNPMHTSLYSKKELSALISFINNSNIKCLTVVDTMGIMTEKDTLNIFEYIDNKLNSGISIGLHSHNNLKLSFKNTKTLLNMNLSREIITDSCLMGISRGAGTVSTESIAQYLNENFLKKYDIMIIDEINNSIIKNLFDKYQYGHNQHYFLSAKNKCHPNYAKFLIENNITDNNEINKILSSISDKNKIKYDEDVIKTLINKL